MSARFFQLVSAGSHSRSAAHGAQVKVKLHPLIPWAAASKLCLSTVCSFAGMYTVQSSAFTPPSPPLSPVFLHGICPRLAPRLSLQSAAARGVTSLERGGKRGGRDPRELLGGGATHPVLKVWGCKTLWKQCRITQQDGEEKESDLGGRISDFYTLWLSCPGAYWILING